MPRIHGLASYGQHPAGAQRGVIGFGHLQQHLSPRGLGVVLLGFGSQPCARRQAAGASKIGDQLADREPAGHPVIDDRVVEPTGRQAALIQRAGPRNTAEQHRIERRALLQGHLIRSERIEQGCCYAGVILGSSRHGLFQRQCPGTLGKGWKQRNGCQRNSDQRIKCRS